MRILLLTQYYAPESVGPAIWLKELTAELTARGHNISVLTGFPNHPTGRIFVDYRGRYFQRETIDNVEVIRTWLYATAKRSFWIRSIGFASFTASALITGLLQSRQFDVIYTILQPLTLGVTAVVLGKHFNAKVVLNIQDLHPYAAIALGLLRNRSAIRLLEKLELWTYRQADHIVAISSGFEQYLKSKGVPSSKIDVISNWADPDFVRPGSRDNSFRKEIGVGDDFTLIYSGGLTYNSCLEPVLKAAEIVGDEPFSFVIVGDGVYKETLQESVTERRLSNVIFKPFQPLDRYPEVLRAADMSLVTLRDRATYTSVPSKIYKLMASGRAVLAVCDEGNELARLTKSAKCGVRVSPDNPAQLAEALRWARKHPQEVEQMGRNGRRYLEENHNCAKCVEQLEATLRCVIN